MNSQTIRAAIEGLELRKQQIDEDLQELRSMIDGENNSVPAVSTISTDPTDGAIDAKEAFRKKMSLAMKKRWKKARAQGKKNLNKRYAKKGTTV